MLANDIRKRRAANNNPKHPSRGSGEEKRKKERQAHIRGNVDHFGGVYCGFGRGSHSC
jgi:hypothetical protein